MPSKLKINKYIKVGKHKFKLEIYLALDGHRKLTWEIFPENYDACMYAFSNKKRIEDIVEKNHIHENTKV